ncbi:MAG: DUF2092 domain-containing protein [Phycisphaerae bacterium]
MLMKTVYARVPALACTFAILGALAGCAAPGARAAPAVSHVVDARADAQLRRMTSYLSGLKSFRFKADVTYDDYLVETQKVQLAKRVTVEVQRPNRARGVVDGDVENKRYWYDGKQVTLLDVDHAQYSTADVPDTIDATLDVMADKYGMVLPLAELIAAQSYAWLTNNVQSATYVGQGRVGDAMCHHLAYEQETLDWQIWIDAGEPALPRKLLICYKQLDGCPQYEATFTNWEPSATLNDADFTATLPKDAVRVELGPPQKTVGTGTAPNDR